MSLRTYFSRLVGGVRLAGEQEMFRPVVFNQDVGQTTDVVKDEIRPLVGGATAREAKRERAGLEPFGFRQAGEVIGRVNPGFDHLFAMIFEHGVDMLDQQPVVLVPGLLKKLAKQRQVLIGDGGKTTGIVAPVAQRRNRLERSLCGCR